jgi:hypothetical protein
MRPDTNNARKLKLFFDALDAHVLVITPYGGDLALHVARARDGGHEILLQVPTLLTSLDAGQNLDRILTACSG